jgi:glycosyltransferase involved in cell wall biosynthesis
MRPLKIPASAYACQPSQGSEPGIGWNVALGVAKHHEVWVLTREDNRPAIEAELGGKPVPNLHFEYCNLPSWGRRWKGGRRGAHFHYYLWQVASYFVGRTLNRCIGFDLVHHVTYQKYSVPSYLVLLSNSSLWKPVGGESAPKAFWVNFGLRGIAYEAARGLVRLLGEYDPLTRLTARRSIVALATEEKSAARLRRIGANAIQTLTGVGLSNEDIKQLSNYPSSGTYPVRFISLGRLLHWKGFDLGLSAFAEAGLNEAEYWVVGDGPERKRLEIMTQKLDISDRVRFWGALSRQETLAKLERSHVLVHPSLHDSGGWVVLETMAAGRPVVCLDLGGPATQVTEQTGIKVSALNPKQAVADLAEAMRCLGSSQKLRETYG